MMQNDTDIQETDEVELDWVADGKQGETTEAAEDTERIIKQKKSVSSVSSVVKCNEAFFRRRCYETQTK